MIKKTLSVLVLLIILGLAMSAEQQEEQEKIKHLVFRTDSLGFEVIRTQFTHIFITFYEGEDLSPELEEYLDNYIRTKFSGPMIFLAMKKENNQEFMKEAYVNTEFKNPLILFKNQVVHPFDKNLEKENFEIFEEWALTKTVLNIFELQNKEDLDVLLRAYENNSVILYKGIDGDEQLQTFKQYIQQNLFSDNGVPDVYYYNIPEQKNSTVLLLKSSPYDEDTTFLYNDKIDDINAFTEFLRTATIKQVNTLTDSSYISVFGSPIKYQVLFFKSKDVEKNQALSEVFESAAKFNMKEQLEYQRAVFTYVEQDSFMEEMKELFEIKQENLPEIIVTKTEHSQFDLIKFRFNDHYKEQTEQNIIQFIEDVQLKKVDPYYISEEIPKYTQKQKFRKIVGKNFRDEVIRSNTGYLVLFWDSKNREACDKYFVLIDSLLKEFQNEDYKKLLTIGEFDLNLNENPAVNINMAPQLVIYPKQDKRKGVPFDMPQQSLENLKLFLRQWVQDIEFEKKEVKSLGSGEKTDL